jgi:general secretion pathway protein M
MNAFAQAWSARSPRERRVIAIAAILLAAVLLATLAWLPLERTRARLAQQVPALRASIAALERDAQEVKRLRAMPQRQAVAASPLAALAAGAGGLAGAQVTVLDERRVRVSGADVAYGALLEWLGAAQASHGLRVESAKLDALPAAGRVRAELVLTRA